MEFSSNTKQILKKYKKYLKKKIGLGRNSSLFVHAIKKFYKNTDELIDVRIRSGAVNFDCKKGCTACCHLRVEVLPPEAFVISDYLKSKTKESVDYYIDKLREHVYSTKGLSFEEYNQPCPFLKSSGSCDIYSVRPHKCRAYLSMSVRHCNTDNIATEDMHLNILAKVLSNDCIDVYKSKSCVMHPSELGKSVLAVLEDDSLKEKWADGEQVFDLLPEKTML